MADGNKADTLAEIARECDEIKAMLQAKNRAYGDSVLQPLRVFSKAAPEEQLLVRIDDKLSRLMRGSDAGEDVTKDFIGYLILLRIARRVPPAALVQPPATRALCGDDSAAALERAAANVPHSPEFFAQMKTCREAYKRLALAFASVLPAGCSVLDFGCGTGAQSAALARLGFDVAGWDPLADAADVEPGFEFVHADPIETTGANRLEYDAVICTEVAEHVYPERADALVGAVCRTARECVIWSAARPGQEWEGHVNLQPAEYWREKFEARGFRQNANDTITLRCAMTGHNAQHAGAADNFFVFDRV